MNPQPRLDDESRLLVPDHVLFRKAAGETVLLDLDSEAYFSLDEVGTRFWEHIQAGLTYAEALEALLGEYDVDRATLDKDIRSLTDELVASKLLEVQHP